MADSEFGQLSKIAAQGDLNPIQRSRYEELKAQGASLTTDGASSTSGLNTQSLLDQAKQVNQFYKEQNQPVIAAKEASKEPLKQRYTDLVNSIKGNQQTAENRQTVVTQNELGRRGLTSSSGLAQQELASALNPITQQYTGLIKDTYGQQNQDIAAIDEAIAQLQAGNPNASIQTASGIMSAQQAAQQFAQQLALQQQQQDEAAKSAELARQVSQYNLDQAKLTDPLQLQLLQAQVNKANQANQPSNFNVQDIANEAKAAYTDMIVSAYGMDEAIKMGLVGKAVYGS